jgi:hypothetical protein
MGKNNNITYGLGYQGSKNAIAWQIVNRLPSNDTLVDLFCGGGAITHCAMAPHDRFQDNHGRFKNYIMNDANSLIVKAVKMAFNGEFENETRWISRKEFKKLKDTDPYVAICFSFSNGLSTYLYGEGDTEKTKKALHYAIVFNNWRYFGHIFSKEITHSAKELLEGITDLQERRTRLCLFLEKTLKQEKIENRQVVSTCQNILKEYGESFCVFLHKDSSFTEKLRKKFQYYKIDCYWEIKDKKGKAGKEFCFTPDTFRKFYLVTNKTKETRKCKK